MSKPARFVGTPISRKGRLILAACMLLVALVLGFAASAGVYQYNRAWFRSSDTIGRVLCGPGQHIDERPVGGGRRGSRMICSDASGAEVSARNNLVAVGLALPFILLIGVPGVWFALKADIRETTRLRGRSRRR